MTFELSVWLLGVDIYDPTRRFVPNNSKLAFRLVKFVLKSSGLIVADSNDIAKRAKDILPSANAQVLHIGIPDPTQTAFKQPSDGFSADDFVLASVGRMVKRKGFGYLIQALSLVKEKKVRLVLMGDGPERKSLEQLVSKYDLSEQVRFTGFCSDAEKFGYLRRSHVYVQSSLHEGFGIAMVEAIFFGLPIIASDIGGQRDFLQNSANSLLVPAKNPVALAESIVRLFKDREKLVLLGNESKMVAKDFKATETADTFLSLFSSIEK